MRRLLLLSLTCISVTSIYGQQISNFDALRAKNEQTENVDTVATIFSGVLTFGLNQGVLHNWAAGGELVSATVNGLFNGSYIRYSGQKIWTNNLDLAYGLFYAYSNSFIPRKTDDRIDFTSKYGYRIDTAKNWYLTGLFNAKTQFTKAYDYNMPDWDQHPISNTFSPLYLTLAPGIEYRKGSSLSIFYSPVAMRLTFASTTYTNATPEGAFGIQYGKTSRFEIGSYLTARYKKDFTPSFSYNGRFDLYSNYLAKDTYNNGILVKKDNPGNIDVLWDNNFSFKFYKFFSVNFGVLGIYDNDLPYVPNEDDPTEGLGWWQLKQYLSFGFNYTFK